MGKGSIDAYIHCQYMTSKLNTPVKTAKEGEHVHWNVEFMVSLIITHY